MLAREIMSHPAVTVLASAGIADTARLLAERGFTALPVTDDDGHLIGIVTEADLIRGRIPADPRLGGPTVRRPRSSTGRSRPPETIGSVMTTSVESLTPGADVADAARMMLDENIRCFPIVDGTGVIGVITRRDLLRAAVGRTDEDMRTEIVSGLEKIDESGRFTVTVQAGVADIEDFGRGGLDRTRARTVAASVPGVVATRAHHQTPDPF